MFTLVRLILKRISVIDLLLWLEILAIPGCIFTLRTLNLESSFLGMITSVPGVLQNILLTCLSGGIGLALAILDENISYRLYKKIYMHVHGARPDYTHRCRVNLACTPINVLRFCLIALAEEIMRLTLAILLSRYVLSNMFVSVLLIGVIMGLSHIVYGLHTLVPKIVLHVTLSLVAVSMGLLHATLAHLVFNVYVLCLQIEIERVVCQANRK